MSDLKPCPFCGGKDLTATHCEEHWIFCHDCGGGSGMCQSIKSAEEQWNERAMPELPEAYEVGEGGSALFGPYGSLVAYREPTTNRLRLDICESRQDEAALAIWLQRRGAL